MAKLGSEGFRAFAEGFGPSTLLRAVLSQPKDGGQAEGPRVRGPQVTASKVHLRDGCSVAIQGA
jgi:hypothetical protein